MKRLSLIILAILFLTTPHTIQSQSGIPFAPDNAIWIVQLNQIGDGYLNEFTYSPDAQTIVFAGSLGLWRFDVTTPDIAPQRIGENALYAVRYNTSGTRIATGGVKGIVEIWDTSTWTVLFTITVHTHAVRQIAFSPDDTELVAIAGDMVKILDVQTGETLHELTGHKRPIYDVAYSPDGTQIATASFDDTVNIWDSRTGNVITTITENTESVLCVKYNPEGNLVASSSYDGMVRVFDSVTGELLQTLEGPTEVPYQLAYTEDGKTIFALAQDNTVCSWDVGTGEITDTWEVPPVSEFTQHPDGRIIMMNSYENPVRVWDLQTDETLFTFDGMFLPAFHSMSYLPNDGQLLTGVFDDGVWAWNTASWELVEMRQGELERVDAIATTPDGLLTATALENGDIALSEAETGHVLQTLVGHTMQVTGLTFNPDGTQLISVGLDGTIRIWGCGGNCGE
jgi:DNA-binding beta-propeller fold protein YncE